MPTYPSISRTAVKVPVGTVKVAAGIKKSNKTEGYLLWVPLLNLKTQIVNIEMAKTAVDEAVRTYFSYGLSSGKMSNKPEDCDRRGVTLRLSEANDTIQQCKCGKEVKSEKELLENEGYSFLDEFEVELVLCRNLDF